MVISLSGGEVALLERRLAIDRIRKRLLAIAQPNEYSQVWDLAAAGGHCNDWVVPEGLLFRVSRVSKKEHFVCELVLPEPYRKRVIDRAHNKLGHMSNLKTYLRLVDHYYFENMRRYIDAYFKQCPVCALSKPQYYSTAMQEAPVVDKV